MRKLELSLSQELFADYVSRQLNTFFPDGDVVRKSDINKSLTETLNKIEIAFSRINLSYYAKAGNSWFNHLHGDHYAAFLYLLSNTLYKNGNENAATKTFLLNKGLFGIDAFYQIELPEHFIFVHPVGTILGRATYSDFLVIYQGVTIGANVEGIYPDLGANTILYSNSSIIGFCKTGSGFILGSNSSLVDSTVGENKVVVGSYPNHRVLENNKQLIKHYFVEHVQ